MNKDKAPHIIYEDNHLIVVNKPFGMPSQGDSTGDESVFDWVKSYIRTTYHKPGNVYTALIHRLDRPTGGVLVLGKTSKAAARLSAQFQKKEIRKTYYAISEQIPSEGQGVLIHYLKQLPGKNIMRAYQKEVEASKRAELSYRVLATKGARALIEILLKTGRKHQIRVQLASIGCTIQGDVKYGETNFNVDKSISLLAKKLTLIHPTKKEQMTFEVELPENEIWKPWS